MVRQREQQQQVSNSDGFFEDVDQGEVADTRQVQHVVVVSAGATVDHIAIGAAKGPPKKKGLLFVVEKVVKIR